MKVDTRVLFIWKMKQFLQPVQAEARDWALLDRQSRSASSGPVSKDYDYR